MTPGFVGGANTDRQALDRIEIDIGVDSGSQFIVHHLEGELAVRTVGPGVAPADVDGGDYAGDLTLAAFVDAQTRKYDVSHRIRGSKMEKPPELFSPF